MLSGKVNDWKKKTIIHAINIWHWLFIHFCFTIWLVSTCSIALCCKSNERIWLSADDLNSIQETVQWLFTYSDSTYSHWFWDKLQKKQNCYRKTRLCINSGWCLPTLAIFGSFRIIPISWERACWIATVRLLLSAALVAARPRASFAKWLTVAERKFEFFSIDRV